MSPCGDAAILYLARLRWRSTTLNFSSLLLSQNGKLATRTSIRLFKAFDDERDRIDLTLPHLGVRASFAGEQAPLTRTVLPGVEWHCLQPRSHAAITADDFTLQGLGYVERIDLTVPPWKLHISELHWGRFLSADDSLVWIQIHAASRTTIAVHNGLDVKLAHLDTETIQLESKSTLKLDCHHTLRTGRLSDTVLPAAPVLERFFPRSILNLRETKWCSQATLTTKDRTSAGWAIHEVVKWPA